MLGLVPDVGANLLGNPCISAAGSPVSAWVFKTGEESVIARHTARVLQQTSSRN